MANLSKEDELKLLQSLEFIPDDPVAIRNIANLLESIAEQVEQEEHNPNSYLASPSASHVELPFSRRLSSSTIFHAASTFKKMAAKEKIDSDDHHKALNVYGYIKQRNT